MESNKRSQAAHNTLTVKQADNAKPRDKRYRLRAGRCLYLEIHPTGAKYWVVRVEVEGKDRTATLGKYPDIPLTEARERAIAARAQVIATGETPKQAERAQRLATEAQKTALTALVETQIRSTFEAAARAWHKAVAPTLTAKHAAQNLTTLERYVFPVIGARQLDDIKPGALLEQVLQPMLSRVTDAGIPDPLCETAARVFQRIGAIYEHAGLHGWCSQNPATLCAREFSKRRKAALKVKPKKNYAALKSRNDLAALLRKLLDEAAPQIRAAHWFIACTACRSGELRGAKWSEFNLDAATWNIPASRMKARRPHAIPLSPQALQWLSELGTLSAGSDWVLPGAFGNKPLSDMTLTMALRRLGYEGSMTVHGWRSVFKTMATEAGYRREITEAQLAHTLKDKTESAYLRSDFIEERRAMMEWFGATLHTMATAENVVSFQRKQA